MTALQTSKRNSTSAHARESTSTGTAEIAAVILRRKSLCKMSLMYPQEKSMDVKSGHRGGQLIGPPLPIHRPGNRLSREVRTMAQKLAGAPSCWAMRPSTSATSYKMVNQPICCATVGVSLNKRFPGRWIGRGGPINWPPRCPDLTPMDCGGYTKDTVHSERVESLPDLRQRVKRLSLRCLWI
jgi:hypothetical protein